MTWNTEEHSEPRALLFDIEGTITSLSFVKDELFPYARHELPAFLQSQANRPEVGVILDRLEAQLGTRDPAILARALQQWIDEDRKQPELKELQGLIWEEGYRSGAFRGHLYPDVLPFWERARAAGQRLAIYSSGSVAAQRLLLQHSVFGNVSHLIDYHFDTAVGTKTEAASYVRIAEQLSVAPAKTQFFSDVVAELDAALAAGLGTCRVVRPGVPEQAHTHSEIRSFEELAPTLAQGGGQPVGR